MDWVFGSHDPLFVWANYAKNALIGGAVLWLLYEALKDRFRPKPRGRRGKRRPDGPPRQSNDS